MRGCIQPLGGAVSHLLRNLGLRPPGRAGALGNRGMQGGSPGPRRTLAWALEAVVQEDGGPLQGWLWEGQRRVSSAPAESRLWWGPSGHARLGLCPAPPTPMNHRNSALTRLTRPPDRAACPRPGRAIPRAGVWPGGLAAASLPTEDRTARARLSVHRSRKWKCS